MTPIFIGDELTATGYRLAGLRIRSPRPEETLMVFRWALGETELLLLSVEAARRLPPRELNAALSGLSPQILIVPDVRRRVPMRNLPARIRTELGVKV